MVLTVGTYIGPPVAVGTVTGPTALGVETIPEFELVLLVWYMLSLAEPPQYSLGLAPQTYEHPVSAGVVPLMRAAPFMIVLPQ